MRIARPVLELLNLNRLSRVDGCHHLVAQAISIGGFTYLAVCPDPGVPLNGARSGEDLSEGAHETNVSRAL